MQKEILDNPDAVATLFARVRAMSDAQLVTMLKAFATTLAQEKRDFLTAHDANRQGIVDEIAWLDQEAS
jgi:hypothetical protein